MEFKGMKKLITITLILFCLVNLNGTENEKKNSQQWSDYQGKMNWNDAKAKCASLGMRLPTRAELGTAYKAKVTQSWKVDWQKSGYSNHWTSEEYSASGAYTFYVGDGDDTVSYFKDVDGVHVRCIR